VSNNEQKPSPFPHRLASSSYVWKWTSSCEKLKVSPVASWTLSRKMEKFIHDENIRLYRRLLAEATDAERRRVLLKLLADEEAKDQRPPERKQGWAFRRQHRQPPAGMLRGTAGNARPSPSNENGGCALIVMPSKTPQSDSIGPMMMQPVERPATPTQMLPIMPGTEGAMRRETETPAPEKKPRTRTDAVQAAMARIMRRNSLRKQREAQKS
jgi:hypothetical protein